MIGAFVTNGIKRESGNRRKRTRTGGGRSNESSLIVRLDSFEGRRDERRRNSKRDEDNNERRIFSKWIRKKLSFARRSSGRCAIILEKRNADPMREYRADRGTEDSAGCKFQVKWKNVKPHPTVR